MVVGGSYPSAEVQSVYSTAPADRANEQVVTHGHFLKRSTTDLNLVFSFYTVCLSLPGYLLIVG